MNLILLSFQDSISITGFVVECWDLWLKCVEITKSQEHLFWNLMKIFAKFNNPNKLFYNWLDSIKFLYIKNSLSFGNSSSTHITQGSDLEQQTYYQNEVHNPQNSSTSTTQFQFQSS